MQSATDCTTAPTAIRYDEFQRELQEVMLTQNVSELVVDKSSASPDDKEDDAIKGDAGSDAADGAGYDDFGDGGPGDQNEDSRGDDGDDVEHTTSRSKSSTSEGKGKAKGKGKGREEETDGKKKRKSAKPGSLLLAPTPDEEVRECMCVTSTTPSSSPYFIYPFCFQLLCRFVRVFVLPTPSPSCC